MHRAPVVLLLALVSVRATAGSLPSGTFVIAWDSQGQDGSGYGIFGQIDNHFIPVELMTVGVE